MGQPAGMGAGAGQMPPDPSLAQIDPQTKCAAGKICAKMKAAMAKAMKKARSQGTFDDLAFVKFFIGAFNIEVARPGRTPVEF